MIFRAREIKQNPGVRVRFSVHTQSLCKEMQVPPAPQREPTLLDSVWESIVTPGASPMLIMTINVTLLALVACLGYFCTTYVYSPHLLALIALTVVMMVSFNIFVAYSGITRYLPAPSALPAPVVNAAAGEECAPAQQGAEPAAAKKNA